MSKALLSINPEYVKKIFDGTKRFEFRKTITKKSIDSIVIYETYPTMKVVGEAKVKKIIIGEPNDVWEKTKEFSGVDREFFDKYYQNKYNAVVYELTDVVKYNEPKDLSVYGLKHAPQSFVYLP